MTYNNIRYNQSVNNVNMPNYDHSYNIILLHNF